MSNLSLEKEFQREIAISSFYVWFEGQKRAFQQLGMDESMADKSFAIYRNGVAEVFTQVDNIQKIKNSIRAADEGTLENILNKYEEESRKFYADRKNALDKEFMANLAGGFVLMFILGDMENHPLQKKALELRKKTETLFKDLEEYLTSRGKEQDMASMYTYEEIVSGAVVSREDLVSRKESILDAQGVWSLSRTPLDKYIKFHNLLLKNSTEEITELTGQTAMRGRVRGVCKLVTKREEISKITEGNILVSSMTAPDYLSAMKKAAAFVTDEGGITCHAAIVARELKKPCIIGTKVATQVLKDGDVVEVDADNGVVRIIKR